MILRRIGLSVLACFAITACGETTPAPQDTDTSLVAVDPDAEAEVLAWSDLLPEQDLEALQALSEGRADPSPESGLVPLRSYLPKPFDLVPKSKTGTKVIEGCQR